MNRRFTAPIALALALLLGLPGAALPTGPATMADPAPDLPVADMPAVLLERMAQRTATDDPLDHAFEVARFSLRYPAAAMGSAAADAQAAPFDLQARNLDLAEAIVHRPITGDPLRDAIHVAHLAAWRNLPAGPLLEPPRIAAAATPSAALHAILDGWSLEATPDEAGRWHVLDTLPAPQKVALTDFLNAYVDMAAAVRAAFSEVDPAARTGPDVAGVIAARAAMLDTIVPLRDAFQDPATQGVCDPLDLEPYFSIDLTACDNTYTRDFTLLLDMGGADTYHNNAGGNGVLVDLGLADDTYGDLASPRATANGGADTGAGFLLDEGGNEVYIARAHASNGGADIGAGFLMDPLGDDAYVAIGGPKFSARGANGGSWITPAPGHGFLYDGDGNDLYHADGHSGVNGGGTGFLFDGGGDDQYLAVIRSAGANGGGAGGFLFDEDGDDVYTAVHTGDPNFPARSTNGGGDGFLFDQRGHDVYSTSGDAANGGDGFLMDVMGDDRYLARCDARCTGQNGGAGPSLSPNQGRLLDFDGDDLYYAEGTQANGGASTGSGLLFDAFGSDTYVERGVVCVDCSEIPKGTLGAQVDAP